MRTPLLEGLRFLSITYSNLDEFFMVRVAGKKRALRAGISSSDSPDRVPLEKALKQISDHAHSLVSELYDCFNHHTTKALEQNRVIIHTFSALTQAQRDSLSQYYLQTVLPVLTPLAVDPAHPFPFLANRRLYLLVTFASLRTKNNMAPIAFVEVPSILPRLIKVSESNESHEYVLLEDLIREHLNQLFFGVPVVNSFALRVTRNLDIKLLESEVVDLMSSIQTEVKAREQAEVVRLEVHDSLPEEFEHLLLNRFHLEKADLYRIDGPLALSDFQSLCELPEPQWKYAPFNPRLPDRLKGSTHIFEIIKEQDLLLHHPYDSFYAVIEFLQAAAWDPQVLAIKQTLYRTSGDSPIIEALIQAAQQGKQVTAVVELKARFDENNNISWARRMERAGVHVVYGFIGLKTHCKMSLVVRREDQRVQRYVHLSTGNYNSNTARNYVDIGYITSHPDYTNDTNILFNLLTGFNILSQSETQLRPQLSPLAKLIVAPLELRNFLLQKIDEEIESHKQTSQGLIFVKINALADQILIDKLYEASCAGVEIRLIVRGICCLKPGIPGLSESIKVVSIVGRFLEHSRIFYFRNRGQEDVYLGSADWMQRNMDRRIEIVFPVIEENSKRRIVEEIIPTYWRDTENTWVLDSKGNYSRYNGTEPVWDCHQKFIEIAREKGIKSLPYEKAIRHNLNQEGRPILKKVASKKSNKSKDSDNN